MCICIVRNPLPHTNVLFYNANICLTIRVLITRYRSLHFASSSALASLRFFSCARFTSLRFASSRALASLRLLRLQECFNVIDSIRLLQSISTFHRLGITVFTLALLLLHIFFSFLIVFRKSHPLKPVVAAH